MRLEEVLARLSDFGLQLKAKKCTFMQTEVAFRGHIVGRTGLACDQEKLSAVRNWHEPNRVKAVRQFVGFVGYYRRFVKNFAEVADPLVALTRKGVPFVWGSEQQRAFDAHKACWLSAPILGLPTEEDRFVLDTDASLFAIGGVMSQIQNKEVVVIAYASRSLRISQRLYCTTRREMLAAVVMCTHFRSYLRGSQFTLRTDHSSLRWLQKFKNEDGKSPWIGPYLIVSFMGWTIGIQKEPESPVLRLHWQDIKNIPTPPGAVSWLTSKKSSIQPSVTILGASTMHRTVPS